MFAGIENLGEVTTRIQVSQELAERVFKSDFRSGDPDSFPEIDLMNYGITDRPVRLTAFDCWVGEAGLLVTSYGANEVILFVAEDGRWFRDREDIPSSYLPKTELSA